jgi:hypothetical protein
MTIQLKIFLWCFSFYVAEVLNRTSATEKWKKVEIVWGVQLYRGYNSPKNTVEIDKDAKTVLREERPAILLNTVTKPLLKTGSLYRYRYSLNLKRGGSPTAYAKTHREEKALLFESGERRMAMLGGGQNGRQLDTLYVKST